MKERFFPVVLMLIVLYGGWLFLGYEHTRSQQGRLDALTKLPVYAYVADTTKVAPIMTQLKSLQAIKSITHETAEQAAKELITAYGLPLNEDMIAEYSFPDIITISFEAKPAALNAREIALDILRTQIPETDIDSQSSAFKDVAAELHIIERRGLHFHIFAGVLMLLIYVFSRLSFELHVLLLYKGKKHSIVDRIRLEEKGIRHTWTMLAIPLPLCVSLYFAMVYLMHLQHLLPWWVFVIQASAGVVGTLINYYSLHTFVQEAELEDIPFSAGRADLSLDSSEDNDETPDS